jgi:hypothetical protein
MQEREQKLANIGCLSIILLLVLIFIFIPKEKKAGYTDFEIVSTYDAGKNARVICVYTTCKDTTIIREHGQLESAKLGKSTVIFYYDDKKEIPDISRSGIVIDFEDQKNAFAIFKKYGTQKEELIIK